MSDLQKAASPNLPLAPVDYDRQYQEQLNKDLRLYFNRLNAVVNALLGQYGGQYVDNPFASFSSTATQTVAAPATPTLLTFTTTDYTNGVHYNPGNGFHADVSGVYNLQFSAQLVNSDTQIHDADIWLRKNGVDLPNTASVASVQGTHGGIAGYHIMAANFFVTLQSGDYVELWWASNSTLLAVTYLPSITTPFASPGSPSIVATLSFVSAA